MPHTSRPKRASIPTQKRLQVTDDDGWTHVTSSSNVRRVMRARVPNANQENDTPIQEPILRPAEAPSRLTLSELQTQYATHRARWTESSTWETLTRHLEQIRRKRADKILGPIDAIICIGLGSASGFLRDGWVDRRSVSMYQLAALECIKEQLSQSGDTVPLSVPIYAQDPVFNTLDIALLESLAS
ncbi:hypothetical protein PENDEC_c015G06327 [Penicillium decumbens]|uniref:SRR1-like domain-containing protein n=1 Tax=Penicillium decumbens TaxID=69771 RepID=A0A1V6P9D1_PENDC|nr:hypothetical protein PENDEC_c015G06327 [Penicillium decumbens]